MNKTSKTKKIMGLLVTVLISIGVATQLFAASNQEQYDKIMEAIKQHDSKTVQTILDDGLDPNYAQSGKTRLGGMMQIAYEDYTPLHLASESGQLDVVKLLVEKGADVNKPAGPGLTPLYLAAEKGHEEVARYLVDHKADVNKFIWGKETPLMAAAGKGHLAIVKLLVENGADVNAKEANMGWHSLRYATANKESTIFDYLLSKGADINLRNRYGGSLMHIAASAGNNWLMDKLLANKYSINEQGGNLNNSPLHNAAYEGKASNITMLLEKNADPSIKNKQGYTPLHLAVKEGKTEAVQILLAHGVPVDQKTADGKTSLDIAIGTGNKEVQALLKEKGAKISSN